LKRFNHSIVKFIENVDKENLRRKLELAEKERLREEKEKLEYIKSRKAIIERIRLARYNYLRTDFILIDYTPNQVRNFVDIAKYYVDLYDRYGLPEDYIGSSFIRPSNLTNVKITDNWFINIIDFIRPWRKNNISMERLCNMPLWPGPVEISLFDRPTYLRFMNFWPIRYNTLFRQIYDVFIFSKGGHERSFIELERHLLNIKFDNMIKFLVGTPQIASNVSSKTNILKRVFNTTNTHMLNNKPDFNDIYLARRIQCEIEINYVNV
jgi:hypothetical protein